MSLSKSLIIVSMILSCAISAQELKINVQVSAPRLQTVDPKVFETLEKEIFDFMNNTKWTDDEFEDVEKIEGNLNVTISEELSATTFRADFFLQTIRPVYKSNYKTQLINLVDDGVTFVYVENQPIQNSFSSYIDPLSSLLTYYAYIILGSDYDSFAPLGGDPHYQIAQNIITSIPSNVADGTAWSSTFNSPTSRYNYMENIFDPRVRAYREAVYEYHMKSLDIMHEDPEKAKAIMVSSLTNIEKVNRSYLNTAVIQFFGDSKRQEIIEIFKGGSQGQKTKVKNIMVAIDPAQASEYNALER